MAAATLGSQQVYQQVQPCQQSLAAQLLLSSSYARQPQCPQTESPRAASSPNYTVDLRSLPLAQRLSCVPGKLAQRFPPGTLAIVQVWTSCVEKGWAGVSAAKSSGTVVFRTQPVGAHLSDAALAPFRAACTESGISRAAIGMLGKVWSSGALAVVQNVGIIPTSVHPRNKLDDGMAERVSELAYIPVYDLRLPKAGVVACLEVMMSSSATNALVANVISHTCDLLTQFQLSLGEPSGTPPEVTASPSPFAAVRGVPPHSFTRASMDAPRPPPAPASAAALARASMDCPRSLPPVERHLRTVSPGALLPLRRPGGGSGDSCCSNRSAGSSSPGSPGTPAAAPPLQRTLSMQRTSSVRRLDSLADMVVG